MCIFTGAVDSVSSTKIFARSVDGRQILVYEMAYAADAELAMVLPIPVPSTVSDDAVRFVALDRYPDFFDDLEKGFPDVHLESLSLEGVAVAAAVPLQVHDVGNFEASFVPTLRDFSRLDSRFRLPESFWSALPQYRDYGFAVFKLKSTQSETQVHPMAFEFPRRDPTQIFFPTVHVHDGSFGPSEVFDHILYLQPDASIASAVDAWDKAFLPIKDFMDVERAAGVLDPALGCSKLLLQGRKENRDTIVGTDGQIPQAWAS